MGARASEILAHTFVVFSTQPNPHIYRGVTNELSESSRISENANSNCRKFQKFPTQSTENVNNFKLKNWAFDKFSSYATENFESYSSLEFSKRGLLVTKPGQWLHFIKFSTVFLLQKYE